VILVTEPETLAQLTAGALTLFFLVKWRRR